ncbi:MAG: hypothetical protein E4G98_06820, partial [Promethearchaeota archaeon]
GIKRPEDGGRGLDGVVIKDTQYLNPFIELMRADLFKEET